MSDLNLYPDSNLLTLTMQNVPTTIVLKKCPDKYSYTDTQYPRIKRHTQENQNKKDTVYTEQQQSHKVKTQWGHCHGDIIYTF